MSESRKDWFAARRVGSLVGWFGGPPELEAEPVSPARDREFDTIAATAVPEEGFELLLSQLKPEGRLLIAVPFGATYPSTLVHALSAKTEPLELELAEGELRLAVRYARAGDSAWQRFASPERLLQLTEQGASEREVERQAELGTLRNAYQRLAERVMARATERALPSVATASRVLVLEDKVTDLATRLKTMNDSPDMRVGRALRLAARSPRDAVRLPVRLLRAYVDTRTAAPQALPPPPETDREMISLVRRATERIALIVDGRTFEEASGLERELSMSGWGVVLAATKETSQMRTAQKLLRIELDAMAEVLPTLERSDAPERVAIFRTPHPIAPRWINRLNAWGWVTIYDCIEDWPDKLRFGKPHRYRQAVERFLLHNVDLVCASPVCLDRLRALTEREIRAVDGEQPSARALALIEAARSINTERAPEKRLHARDWA